MNNICHSSSASSTSTSSSINTADPNVVSSRRSVDGGQALAAEPSRRWRDIFWLGVFLIHLILVGCALTVLGTNRFKKTDRLNIDRYTQRFLENERGLTENYWLLYALAGGVGTLLGWTWLFFLRSQATHMMKVAVHILTTYLAVISVLLFWMEQFFWGVAFAIGAVLQFMYVLSIVDRLPFTMLVLQAAVKMVWSLREVMRVAYAFMLIMLLWMVLWSFGAAGVVASSIGDGGRWWLLVVSWQVLLFFHYCYWEAPSMPPNSLMKSLRYAVTTSFGSICYGSLFTAFIRTLRWKIRGVRSKIGNNECLLCCVDFLFHLVETLVRFFNKYAYVQIAVSGKGFNHSARDAWELFQSTGVEALVAYDCSGAVLLMGTVLGGLITGTSAGIWTWIKYRDRVVMVGSTAMLMGMVLVGLAMVVVESAVTSIYICYAEDPLLIRRWDAEFFNQMSEMLHQRLQHRSSRAREVLTHHHLDNHTQETLPA
ncbi:hypothetical protein DVH24_040481 [Malus domestica]|uniref:Choline transporter-like protein n=1 Tax=Malus domestica TaxID=3750 RepID=A0A498IAU0_MALDO|nr:hypothetical protein DVH24_040481 [Malus domestica]